MASRLDDVARLLAAPMSRRRALRVAGAAVVATVVATRAEPARAACPSCPRGGDPAGFTQFCGHERGAGCIFVCCPATYTCCQTDAVVVCCREGYTCGPIVNGGPTCQCTNECGGACCKPGEKCVDMVAGRCCAIPCGKQCCESGEKCVDPNRGVCCKHSERGCIGRNRTVCCDSTLQTCCPGRLVTQCCGYGETCDQETGGCKCKAGHPVPCLDDCCKRTDTCCHGTTSGRGFCAPRGWKCCGDTVALDFEVCCAGRFPQNPNTERCCGISGVCPRSTECCPDGCCPQGTSCCAHGCCAFDGTPAGRAQPFAADRDRRAHALLTSRARSAGRQIRPPVP